MGKLESKTMSNEEFDNAIEELKRLYQIFKANLISNFRVLNIYFHGMPFD